MKRISIDIKGMSCGGCVVAVRNVLGRQAGVSNLNVDVGKATLEWDEAQGDEKRLAEAIARAGFEATAFSPA